MASILENLMQGYVNRVNSQYGGGKLNNSAIAAQHTSSAYQRLQDAISGDYAQQKKNFESDPNNAGKQWSMPSATERFNDQIQAMIMSGDPALQERGLALMSPDAMGKPTDFQRNFEYLKQSNPNLSEMQYFQMLHPGMKVNVNLPKQDQPMSYEDAQKLDWSGAKQQYTPGMTMREAGAAGAKLASTKDQAESAATADTTQQALQGMENANPGTTSSPLQGALAEFRAQPNILGQAINTGLNAAGVQPNQADTAFLSRRSQAAANITRMMSGAAASDQDVARTLSSLPNLSDDAATREIKFKAVRDQVNNVVRSATAKGGANAPRASQLPQAPKAPEAPKAPMPTKRYNPATGKIEAIK